MVDINFMRKAHFLGLMFLALNYLLPFHDLTAQSVDAKNIVILGDRFATGSGLKPSQAYPALLQQKLNESGLDFRVFNLSQEDQTTESALRNLDVVLRQPIEVLIIELGYEDGVQRVPLPKIKQNLLTLIYKAQETQPNIKILLVGNQVPILMGLDYSENFGKIYTEAARICNVTLIPNLSEGIAGNIEMTLLDSDSPNILGQIKVSERLWASLKPLLEK